MQQLKCLSSCGARTAKLISKSSVKMVKHGSSFPHASALHPLPTLPDITTTAPVMTLIREGKDPGTMILPMHSLSHTLDMLTLLTQERKVPDNLSVTDPGLQLIEEDRLCILNLRISFQLIISHKQVRLLSHKQVRLSHK